MFFLIAGLLVGSLKPTHGGSYDWTFAQSSDYTFDAAKIQVSGGTAQLVEASSGWWNANYKYRRQLTVTDGRTAANTTLDGALNNSATTVTVVSTSAFPQSPTILIDSEQLNCGQKTATTFTSCARGANGTTAASHSSGATVAMALPTGYSIELVNNSANAFFTLTQADGDDWRIAYYNGTTWAELDRDLVTYTSSAYDAWFKTQAPITAGGTATAYYVYYGNASATTPTINKNNVYALSETFTYADGALANWSASGGTWEINSNAYRQTVTSGSNLFSTYNNLNLYDFVIEADVQIVSGRTAGLSFRVDDGFGGEPYYAVVDSTLDQLRLLCSNCGAIATYAATIDNGTTYNIRVASLDDNYKVSLDGTQRINATDPDDAFNITTNGELGFITFQTHGRFDNLKIRMYVGTTEPTFAVGSETTRYPADQPTIQPVAATAQSFTTLQTFSETATKNGGEIRYLLSNDGGSSWLYWNGSAWVASDGTVSQTTTAAQAHAQRASFPTGSGSFLFKAFFDSDGTQLITLDTVSLTNNRKPATPTLQSPAASATDVSTTPTLQIAATDADSDAVQFQMQMDTASTFTSANLQTIDQTASQVGWSGQDANSGTAYASGTTATYTVQTALSPSQTYYWRGRAKDPSGANTFSDYTSARSFTTLNDLTVTQLQAATVSPTSATITWTTSRAAQSTLEYGTTGAYGQSLAETSLATSHSLTLSGLTPETLYHYRVTATDALGQTRTSADATFTATATTAITNIAVSVASPTSAAISWQTNHPATSRVEYGETATYGQAAADATTVQYHTLTVTDLRPNTTYHFRVVSVGNSEAASADATFTTTAQTTITNVAVQTSAPSIATVSWTTNHLATSAVHYGESAAYGGTISEATAVLTHTITLTGLKPKTTYHYQVVSVGNSTATTADATFTTPAPLDGPTIVSPGNGERVVERRPTVFGYARSNNTVFIVIDGTLENTVLSTNHPSGTGSFRYTLRRDLAFGPHTLYAVSRAPNGDISEDSSVTSFEVIRPSIGPTLLEPLVRGGAQPTVVVRGLAANDSVVELSLDGTLAAEQYVGYNPTTPTVAFALAIETKNLADGSHTLKARAFDFEGRPSRFSNVVTFQKISERQGAIVETPELRFTEDVVYEAQPDDSLWGIALKFYGDGRQWPRIAAANAKTYPTLVQEPGIIRSGWRLVLPSLAS